MRPNTLCKLLVTLFFALLPICASAQSEGSPSILPHIAGRRELKGTLTSKQFIKTFSDEFRPGLYRLTYFSEKAPAVLEVRTAQGKPFARSAPTIPFATILGGRTGRPTELSPPGLCTSDVAPEETCAIGKLHFRVISAQKLTIAVEGLSQSPGAFTLVLDPLQEQPETHTLSPNGVVTNYLAYASEPHGENPEADFSIELSKDQRIGILLGSPDFTTELELLDASGKVVASNSEFNEFLDPCREVRIDRLPKFDPLSQSNSYFTYQSSAGGNFKVRVLSRYHTETGLYVLRDFDVSDSGITPGQMRTGYITGQQSPEFTVRLPAGWQSQGGQIVAYSPLPIRLELTNSAGQSLAEAIETKAYEFESGLHPHDLEMLHSSSISLDKLDVALLASSKIRVRAKTPETEQFFLVGFATRWGSCGGGAVEPIAVLYPSVTDFADHGYPLSAPKMFAAELEGLLYSIARTTLRWNFLLQSPTAEDKDPQILISSYARYVPEHSLITELLVDFQVAIRVQYSPSSGAARLWTRVERHGYKEKEWHMDTNQTAKAQQVLVTQVEQALRGRTK